MDVLGALRGSLGPVLRGRVLFAAPTRAPRFALTVDDGPDPATTPALLDTLRHHGARATFFVLGERVRRHPDLTARIVAEGHELGNHTWRDEPSRDLAPEAFRESLRATQRELTAHGPVRWFRPGSGWPTARTLTIAGSEGLRCALGSAVAIADAGAGTAGTGRRLDAVVHRGAVVVLHEGPQRAGVPATVDDLLARTTRRGLTAVTLTELAGPG